MPTIETRNIIQDARDQLVGKVPLPIDQCNEITRALIYKFLSATDTESIEDGGQPTYFAGDNAEFHWDSLMASEQTALEISRRYTAGLAMLGGRQDIPAVFRAFYQNAVVPYDDEVVLRDFLNIIDRFDTGDTETIGDAYETMLQYLGAQASAGQFRTPRHIIDFIVAIVDPQKRDSILDPACGTGGFLASAWQHINRADDLTADDRSRLAGSIVGYDISPDMVRLASINLYLSHGQDPDVSVYDTLTHEDHWNDHYDVILANPPFMTPKGGIRPHQRYSISSRRSEALFVDYIMTHLNDRGRAGVIVPEGVIFQQQRGHTELRRLLVESCLVAVISLPGGVFQPYSGVKTSILIMDKALGRKTDHIAFFKVENDGYDLGAQRRPIAANDLPAVQTELAEYLRRLRGGLALDDFAPTTGLVVAKARIAEGGDWNLGGERYRESFTETTTYPRGALGTVTKFFMDGDWIESKDQSDSGIRLGSVDILPEPDESGGEMQEAQVSGVQLLKPGEDPAIVLHLVDEAFHQMTLSVQMPVIVGGFLAVRAGRNDRHHTQFQNVSAKLLGIVPLVGQYVLASITGD